MLCPDRLAVGSNVLKNSRTLADLPVDTRQHQPVRRFVGVVIIGGIEIDKLIARSDVVLSKVQESRTDEAICEFPVRLLPAFPTVRRPGHL